MGQTRPHAMARAQRRGTARRAGGPPRNAKMPLVGQRRPALPRTHSAVPSALGGLTSGFGMGPGVPPPPWSLTNEGHSAVRGRPGRALRAAQRATGWSVTAPDDG